MCKNENIKAKSNKGFTLIELSIVIVVIGLIVGGILAGQDVLKATKRASIITEIPLLILKQNIFTTSQGILMKRRNFGQAA